MKLSGRLQSDSCTERQQEAIRHRNGPCMVLAGPGSGKTFVITRRIKYLIEKCQVEPEKILVITFSKASALEMKERFMNLCGEKYYPVTFGTFHAVYYQMIKRAYQLDGNHIITETEKRNLCKEILNSYSSEYIVDEEMVESVLKEISIVKNSGKRIAEYQAKIMEPKDFRNIFLQYRKEMSIKRKIDFDDMVLLTYELFHKRPDIAEYWQNIYEYILIDEFQDINQLQFQVVQMLLGKNQNLFVVGDDDQAIYGFRGSRPEIMLHFKKWFPDCRQILLDYNFRSNQVIVEGAQRVISENSIRYPKEIKATKEKNPDSIRLVPLKNEEEELEHICRILLSEKESKLLHENAVLFRMNKKMENMMELLTKYQISYACKELSKSVYDHFVAKDLIAYLRFASGDYSRGTFFEIMNKPVRYLKREDIKEEIVDLKRLPYMVSDRSYVAENVRRLQYDIKKLEGMNLFASLIYVRKGIGYDQYLKKLAREQGIDPISYLEIADEICNKAKEFSTLEDMLNHIENVKLQMKKASIDQEGDRVTLITMHSAKGLEWEKVYIPFANEGALPSPKALTKSEVEEERRLFYVAMTRAKNHLTILWETGSKENPRMKSRFLIPILQMMSKMSINFSTNC